MHHLLNPLSSPFFFYVSRWGGARVAKQESHKRLSKIGSRLKPEILRFLLDRTISVDVAGRDDPDTTVTVQSFLCHYDRTFRSNLVTKGVFFFNGGSWICSFGMFSVETGEINKDFE